MKNPLILLLVLLTALSATVSAQSIGVFTWDSKGKFTNVRNAPNGKIIDRIPTSEAAMIGVEKPTDGWWKIVGDNYDTGDSQLKVKSSDTGCWILLRPMDIKGDWVKVKTIDGKYTGWIEEEWLCGNALTNCC